MDEPKRKTYQIDVVVEGLTPEQADDLVSTIIRWADDHHTVCGGGVYTTEDDQGESKDEQKG